MIDTNLFQNSHLFWPVSIVALILWILFLWKEWINPIKNRFYLHALISLIAIGSFAMLALKPLSKNLVHTSAGVLLTEGYSQKRLDSLKKNLKGIKSIDYQKNFPIEETLDSIGSLFILGNGVESYDLWQFKNRSVIYLGTDIPSGIIDLKYSREYVLGDNLNINVRFHKVVASHRLVLQDGNSLGLDSIALDAPVSQEFELSSPLKATGKFVYQLVEKDSLGVVVLKEPVPFMVKNRTSLKILLVNGFPTFETKYLKNYLAEMGHEVVVRSQLTRGRYKFEYFNTKRIPIYRLEEKELEEFDLMIIDGTSFRNLTANAWASIEKTIKNSELGLFVQPESYVFNRPSQRLGLEFERDGISKVVLNEFPKLQLEKFPFRFKGVSGIEEIHSSNKNIATAYRRMHKGRIGVSLIQNTYQLQLDGKTRAYRQFWSEIVNKLSKKKGVITDWAEIDNFPLENHPFQFLLRTRIEKPQVFRDGKNQIPLKQHIDIPSHWSGTTYPKHQGWNTLHLKTEAREKLDFYVFDSTSWRPLKAKKIQDENRRYFDRKSQKSAEKLSSSPINSLWFFVIGVFSLSYLWLYPKVFRN